MIVGETCGRAVPVPPAARYPRLGVSGPTGLANADGAGSGKAVVRLRALGALEAAIMDVLWSGVGAMRVRDVVAALEGSRPVAYTTAMTVLDNLHRKGWVRREMHGRAYHYTTTWSREEATARALREMLDESSDPEAALLHFARSVSPRESELLREALDRPGTEH